MNIRTIAILPAVILSWANHIVADEKNTAKYVLANKSDLAGKNVALHVTHVTPTERKKAPADLAVFLAHTYDEKEHVRGGAIMVVATADDAKRLKTKFGVTPRVFGRKEKKAITKTLKGKVTIHQKGRHVLVTISNAAGEILTSMAESGVRSGKASRRSDP